MIDFTNVINKNVTIINNYCERINLEGHKIYIAEINGKIIGFIYGFIFCVLNIYLKPIAILDDLFVEEEYRNNGCALKLINEFIHFAKENGACRIELKVLSKNENAIKLYNKFSFTGIKKYMELEL